MKTKSDLNEVARTLSKSFSTESGAIMGQSVIEVLKESDGNLSNTEPMPHVKYECFESTVFTSVEAPNEYACAKRFRFGPNGYTLIHTHSRQNNGTCALVNKGAIPLINMNISVIHDPITDKYSVVLGRAEILSPGEGVYDEPKKSSHPTGHFVVNPHQSITAQSCHGYHVKQPEAANDLIFHDNPQIKQAATDIIAKYQETLSSTKGVVTPDTKKTFSELFKGKKIEVDLKGVGVKERMTGKRTFVSSPSASPLQPQKQTERTQ